MTLRSALLLVSLTCFAPLACAVETQSFPDADEPSGGTSSVSSAGSTSVPSAGTKSTTTGGSGAFGGTGPMTGGKGGSSSSGGQSSGGDGGASSTAGSGGSSMGGSANGGSASGGGPGGSGSTGGSCSGLKEWKPADSTWSAQVDDVIQWMGKRYKVNVAIVYPNAECGPDSPADWCANWWTADGSC